VNEIKYTEADPIGDLFRSFAQLDGIAQDELFDRLSTAREEVEAEPDGAYINRDPDGKYTPTLFGETLFALADDTTDGRFEQYSDALDRLRVALDDALVLNPEDVTIFYADYVTGMRVQLVPLGEIVPDEGRPKLPADNQALLYARHARSQSSVVGHETLCCLCGELFAPADPADVTHAAKLDGSPCFGPGVIVGWWSSPAERAGARFAGRETALDQPANWTAVDRALDAGRLDHADIFPDDDDDEQRVPDDGVIARVLITFPDVEALEDSAIENVQIVAPGAAVDPHDAQLLINVSQAGAIWPPAPVTCVKCEDILHGPTDAHPELAGVWWDSSGDDTCIANPIGDETLPVRKYGPHIPSGV